MKKAQLFIRFFLSVAVLLPVVSCGSRDRKSKNLSQEEIRQKESALADSVLSIIDDCAQKYQSRVDESFRFNDLVLTAKEKLVKPEYLLDVKTADLLVTRSQKISALAIYLTQEPVRELYDMPVDEVKALIIKLAVDLGYPVDKDYFERGTSISAKVRQEYLRCKEKDEIDCFWQFHRAAVISIEYVISQNPELFFSKINPRQWAAFQERAIVSGKAARELAVYDRTFESLLPVIYDEGEDISKYASIEYVKGRYSASSARLQQQYLNLFK